MLYWPSRDESVSKYNSDPSPSTNVSLISSSWDKFHEGEPKVMIIDRQYVLASISKMEPKLVREAKSFFPLRARSGCTPLSIIMKYFYKKWLQLLPTGTPTMSWKYRITGIFCGCLIFAEFCGSIEIAEIKNRKIFQFRYNDKIVSEIIVQSRIFRCLSSIVVEWCGIHSYIMYTWIWDYHLNGTRYLKNQCCYWRI